MSAWVRYVSGRSAAAESIVASGPDVERKGNQLFGTRVRGIYVSVISGFGLGVGLGVDDAAIAAIVPRSIGNPAVPRAVFSMAQTISVASSRA
jgi:hypothetical protein